MTSEPQTSKINRSWTWGRFVITAALAFGATWSCLYFQERFFPQKPAPASANQRTRRHERNIQQPRNFKGWDENRCQVVAMDIVKEGIPVPLAGEVVYHLRKSGVWGKGYQGFIESPYRPERVQDFYLKYLPQAGWRPDTAFSQATRQAGTSGSLRFTRGPATVMVNIFKNKDNDQSTDFRVSITCK